MSRGWTLNNIFLYQFTYPFTYWRASWLLPSLGIINKAVINICVQMVFIFFGQIPRSTIAGSYGMNMFSFVKSCQTILHSGCTILIPIRNEKVLVLLHILSEFGGVIVLDFGHPKRCIVYTFSRSAKVFYTTAEPFYILTNNVQGVIFLCILINTCFLCFKVIPVSVN